MSKEIRKYDFALSWPDVEDVPFINWLQRECKVRGMSFLQIHDGNVSRIINKLDNREIIISFLLDMNATYNIPDDLYAKLSYAVKDNDGTVLDDPDDAKVAIDKSITHFAFQKADIPTPFTIIIRNWQPDKFKLTKAQKEKLGRPFVIKPANGFGRFGVVTDAVWNVKKIAEARKFNSGDNFLLQEKIEPVLFGEKLGWFRVYHIYNEVIPMWWHPVLGEYEHLTFKEMVKFKLFPVVQITRKISQITRMDWFSTEIAFYKNGKNIMPSVIDYVNDQCDVDIQSQFRFAPPDHVVEHIAVKMVDSAWRMQNDLELHDHNRVWFAE
ncbi:MAG: hypothetical protein KKH98_14055 [Spirochaetes bacterium]|nr:hypothetical protein [Spirochaetota bacterium]